MIEVRALSYSYRLGQVAALSDVEFDIASGEIFGFLGPSGAGKSTTQKILIGILRDYLGSVRVFGQEVREWNSSLYERIGVSFEFPNHFLKLSALENLQYFSRLYQGPVKDVQEILARVGLADDGEMPVQQFSKGMKNRLSVARALIPDAELLFLDEPTAGLDPLNARRIRELIRAESNAGKTIFLTTHDMTVADELCHRVAFIDDGRLLLVDRPAELKLRYGRRTVRVEFDGKRGPGRKEFPLSELAGNHEFLELLRQEQIRTLHTMEATLEEVFLEVTGKKLA